MIYFVVLDSDFLDVLEIFSYVDLYVYPGQSPSVLNVTVYDRIRRKTAVLLFVFRCKRWPFFDVNYTVSHDRNIVPAKRAIYGTFTAVSLLFLNV